MSFRDEMEDARVLLRKARAMLNKELSYTEWADGFGARVAEAKVVLADAGVTPTKEGVSVAHSVEALREALDKADALLNQAGADAENWVLEQQLDTDAQLPEGSPATEAYDICDGVIAAGLKVGLDQ